MCLWMPKYSLTGASPGPVATRITGLRLGVRRDPQLAEFLDPVAAAGLADVGLAATFRLHVDVARPQQPGGNAGGVGVLAAGDAFP